MEKMLGLLPPQLLPPLQRLLPLQLLIAILLLIPGPVSGLYMASSINAGLKLSIVKKIQLKGSVESITDCIWTINSVKTMDAG
jgi:hypothetical protein